MTTKIAEVTDLTARLHSPLTLADVLSAARHPSVQTAASIAGMLRRWAEGAGNAADAVLNAPAAGLADLVRDYSPMCEGCRAPLPDWTERVEDDVPLSWCPTCAVVDQHASPQNWRGWMQDRLDDTDGHDK